MTVTFDLSLLFKATTPHLHPAIVRLVVVRNLSNN